jgi:hypothetical protein
MGRGALAIWELRALYHYVGCSNHIQSAIDSNFPWIKDGGQIVASSASLLQFGGDSGQHNNSRSAPAAQAGRWEGQPATATSVCLPSLLHSRRAITDGVAESPMARWVSSALMPVLAKFPGARDYYIIDRPAKHRVDSVVGAIAGVKPE